MEYTTKKQAKSEIEYTVTIPVDEYRSDMETAAQKISARVAIKGFRKGSAPYDIVKKEVGEMAILQEALNSLIQRTFVHVVKKNNPPTIGMPQISIEKAAPGNDLVYRATVALMPAVKLPNLDKITVRQKNAAIDEKELEKTLLALRGMHAIEIIKLGAATDQDKLVIDMNMSVDGVPVEGGQAIDYQVYLSEDHYIPGFNAELIGVKKGDERKFTLAFPKDHYQTSLAGKDVNFSVTVKDVYTRELPELDDAFAKNLGQASKDTLIDLLKENMQQEAGRKAAQTAEIEMLDKIVEKTTFEEIPDVIIDAERQKMFYELKQDLERHNVEIGQYLADIKKTEQEVYEDFREQADKRAKAALVSRQVALEHDIRATDDAIDAELENMRQMYADNKEYLEKLSRPETRDTVASSIQNKAVIDWLRERIVKQV